MPNNAVLVELHVPDFAKAESFYKLFGFQVVRAEKNYRVLKSGETLLCFYGGTTDVSKHSYFKDYPADTKRGYAVEVILFVEDVKSLYQQVKDHVKVVASLQVRLWGVYDFRVEDPFGYYLRVSEHYDIENIV